MNMTQSVSKTLLELNKEDFAVLASLKNARLDNGDDMKMQQIINLSENASISSSKFLTRPYSSLWMKQNWYVV